VIVLSNNLTWQSPLRLTLLLALALAIPAARASAQPHGQAPSPTPNAPPTPSAPPASVGETPPASSPDTTPAEVAPTPNTTPEGAPALDAAPAASAEPTETPAPQHNAASVSEAAAAPAADEASAAPANELGEVIVSARRRNESAQKIPVAVNVLSGDSLESKGSVNLQSFSKEVPSITTYSANARNTTINIRGLGTGIAASGSGLDSGVGFYVDDIYYGRLSQSMLNLIDIERIEVLRGPQGTLFGRNTTAGAISVVTRGPSFTPEGTADLSIGNYGYLQARGSLSGPIVDQKLAARVSVEAQTRDGFLYSTQLLDSIHRQDSFSVRGQLLYQPFAKLKFRLIADYAKFGQSCCTSSPIGETTQYDNGTAVAYPFSARAAQFGYVPLPYDPASRKVDVNRQRVFRVELGGVSLRGDWDLDSHTLTSIVAARAWNTSPRNDGDYTALDVLQESNQDDRQKQFTAELRLASNGTQAVDYVTGLYFLYQNLPSRQRADYGQQAGEYYIAPGTAGLTAEQRAATLNGAYYRAPSTANTLSAAAFGQATWHILDSLDFTGGLRYTFEHKSGHFQSIPGSDTDTSSLNAAQLALRSAYTPSIPYYELDKSWNSFGALATLSQKLGQDKLIFITYSRGSKSGGLNLTNLPEDAIRNGWAIIKPETVDHFELGLKSQWFARRLTVNASVFNTEIRDYQNTVVDLSGTTYRWYLSNVGSVRSRGVELEVKTRPVRNLNLYASGTYNIAEYKSYKNAQCPWEDRAPGQPVVCDLSGQQLPVAPKFSASAGGDFTLSLTDHIKAFVGVDYAWRSSYTTTTNNSRYSRVSGVGLVNARLGLKDADGRWEANIWSQNLFNELYFLSKSVDEQTGRYSGLLGDPRTFGATARYYFN